MHLSEQIPGATRSWERDKEWILPRKPREEPVLPTPWSLTSGLQNVREEISIILSTPIPSLWSGTGNKSLSSAWSQVARVGHAAGLTMAFAWSRGLGKVPPVLQSGGSMQKHSLPSGNHYIW